MAARCARDTDDSCRVKETHMPVTKPHSWRTSRWAAIAIVISLGTALLAGTACGSGGTAGDAAGAGQETFQKITLSDRVFAFDHLAAAGFKDSTEYDVAGLSAATGAWYGWWAPPGSELLDYEVRFYGSHEDAVKYGTPFAEEASGENAVVNSEDATWKEGVRDRRVVIGATGTVSNGVGPKYGDYVIFANVVMLCEGLDSAQSLERCESLALALRGSSAD